MEYRFKLKVDQATARAILAEPTETIDGVTFNVESSSAIDQSETGMHSAGWAEIVIAGVVSGALHEPVNAIVTKGIELYIEHRKRKAKSLVLHDVKQLDHNASSEV